MTPDETKIANTMFVRGLQDTMRHVDWSEFFAEETKQAVGAAGRLAAKGLGAAIGLGMKTVPGA